MFYRMKVVKELLSIFNTLGLGDAYRNNEFLTNFIVDQGTRNFLKEAKRLGFDPKSAALYCIRESLMRFEEEAEHLPESVTSKIDLKVVQILVDALGAVGLTLDR